MKTKDLNKLQGEIAKQRGFNDWFVMVENYTKYDEGKLFNLLDEVANRYAQQFQSPTDTIVTEISVMQERIAELEDAMKLLVDECDGNNFSSFRYKIESLINKGK